MKTYLVTTNTRKLDIEVALCDRDAVVREIDADDDEMIEELLGVFHNASAWAGTESAGIRAVLRELIEPAKGGV